MQQNTPSRANASAAVNSTLPAQAAPFAVARTTSAPPPPYNCERVPEGRSVMPLRDAKLVAAGLKPTKTH